MTHPVLVAHRGDPRHAPENTLTSFRQALAHGARRLEADARRTSDGTWVVFHDPTLRRVTGCPGRLAETPWNRLKELDAGGWFSRRFRGERVPRLEDLLVLCRDRGVDLFLDIKEDCGERDLLAVLRRSGWLRRVRVLAGTIPSLRRWRRILPPGHPLYWVTGFRDPVTPARVRQARRLQLTGLAAYKGRVRPDAVGQTHHAGLELYVWTVRAARELTRYARMGVDGMMSEIWPHHLRQ